MEILAVRHAVPTRRVTNEDCYEAILQRTGNGTTADQRRLLVEELRGFFEVCGTHTRYISHNGSSGKRPLDYVVEAGRQALESSGVPPEDVDLLIYTGVGRGWIEPATAGAVQAGLGLGRATCFDLLDACASWLRAVQVARSLIQTGTYRTAMIVNCECSLADYLHWEFQSVEELRPRLASFTIGEAATATILSGGDGDDDFYCKFNTFGEHYRLCMIPMANVSRYLPESDGNGLVPNRFYAQSKELVGTTVKKVIEAFQTDENVRGRDYDVVFTHAASQRASQFVLQRLGIAEDRFFGTHPRYGNTVSASVPLAMSLAMDEGRLRRGDKVLVLMGSAGISVGVATFTF